ncbi:MAG TPA: molybdate ABC transporter substrate-binding protein, partial [Gemmatimonadales bacterium]
HFERAHPRTRIRFSFAGSQHLALQLEQGAHADLLAFADERWAGHLARLGLLAGAAEIFAHNRLVVIVPAANPAGIGRLEDLARAGVKTVVAAPAVPAGGYTREVLARLARAPGFPADYARRVLANVVSEEENVKAVVAKVQLGEADAGVVYASDAAGPAGRRLRVIPIPDERNVVADYPIAVLRAARAPRAAAAFAVLVLGPEGRRVLARHGLAPGTPPIGPATAGRSR